MKLKPLFDRIIVERLESEGVTKGGIIIPNNAKEKPIEGIVIRVSKNVKNVKKGDKVLFSKFTGNEVKVDNKIYLIMKEIDILGVIDES